MPKTYDDEAKELCFKLFLKHKGGRFDLIEQEMRAAGYPKFTKQCLLRKDNNWIDAGNWRKGLTDYLDRVVQDKAVTDSERQLKQLCGIRDRIFDAITEKGVHDADLVRNYRDIAAQCTAMMARLDSGTANYAACVAAWEMMLAILPEIDEAIVPLLLKAEQRLFERIKDACQES